MKQRHFRRTLAILLMAAMFLAAGCAGALAEGENSILLPTPPPSSPTATPEPAQQVSLDPAEEEQPVGDLPDPSHYIHSTGTEQAAYLTIGESTYDARIYPVYNIGNAISEYLTACSDAGYKWEISDIFTGYLAYRIFGGGKNAYFVPDYGTSILLLAEQGMPVQEMMPAPEAYEKNKLLISVNDAVFQTGYAGGYLSMFSAGEGYVYSGNPDSSLDIQGNNIVFYSGSAPYQLVGIVIPKNARTSEIYTIRRGSSNPGIGFALLEGYTPRNPDSGKPNGDIKGSMITVMIGDNNYDKYRIGLESDSDYLSIQLIYINGSEYRGRVEGVLNNGGIRVSGTFWVVK